MTAPAMSLAQDSLMPQPVRIPVSQVCLVVIFWMLDVGFVEFRGLRPPNLLIVNSHLSIVNGQGGIGGFILVFIEILAALGRYYILARRGEWRRWTG